MKNKLVTMIASNIIILGMIGCSVNLDERTSRFKASDKNGGGINSGRTSDGTGVTGPKKQYKLCEYSSEHRGMGGAPIETRLKGNLVETNKDQIKPFRALESAYRRMGFSATCLQGVGNSFTDGPDRFLLAQSASIITISAMHSANLCVAEDWIGKNGGDPGAPTVDKAKSMCREFISVACMEEASDIQLNACSDLIVSKTASENNNTVRYAHGLAAVLSSACVNTY